MRDRPAAGIVFFVAAIVLAALCTAVSTTCGVLFVALAGMAAAWVTLVEKRTSPIPLDRS